MTARVAEMETALQRLEQRTMSDIRSPFDPSLPDVHALEQRCAAALAALSSEEPLSGNAALLISTILRSDVPALFKAYAGVERAVERLEIALISERIERARLVEERDLFQQELPVDRRRHLLNQLEHSRTRRFNAAIDQESP